MTTVGFYQQEAREIPIVGDYDVVVVGGRLRRFCGGGGGFAQRSQNAGAVQFPFFGGTATASLMANIVGTRNQVEPNRLQVCRALAKS